MKHGVKYKILFANYRVIFDLELLIQGLSNVYVKGLRIYHLSLIQLRVSHITLTYQQLRPQIILPAFLCHLAEPCQAR
jgi:hypothetical protein